MSAELPSGRVLSVNVARVSTLAYRGREVASAIDKRPVSGEVRLGAGGLAGDEQADGRYHGGVDQALCVYPVEHYDHWARELGRELTHGAFGENLVVSGLTEDVVCVGDVFELGGALVQVTAPRTPCYKPGVHNRASRLKQAMKDTGRVGYYMRVLRPGTVQAGGHLDGVRRAWPQLTVEAAFRARGDRDPLLISLLLAAPELAERYRTDLLSRLG